ncbi:MAG: hypothetical protein NTZ69_02700 [Bacteroidia bacterium]|nr:hypothetical protein [Bacteroidia bacterium]
MKIQLNQTQIETTYKVNLTITGKIDKVENGLLTIVASIPQKAKCFFANDDDVEIKEITVFKKNVKKADKMEFSFNIAFDFKNVSEDVLLKLSITAQQFTIQCKTQINTLIKK